MLVIRRREGESVVIDGGIEVTVLELSASRVKLGIMAPAAVQVARKELHLAAEQNRQAAERPTSAHLDRAAASLLRRHDRES